MHPTWYARSINNDSGSGCDETCEQCGIAVQTNNEQCHTKNESFNRSAAFMRNKYYSRLTDPTDDRMRMPDHILPSSMFLLIPAKPEASQSSIVTIFAIWNTMMGTSLLSMPWGIGQSGFILGILIIAFTGLLAFYTAYRVVKSKDYVDIHVFEFSDVTKYYFGTIGEWTAVLFGLLAFLGGMMVYWVLMTNFLYMTGVFIHDKAIHDNSSTNTDVLCVNAPPVHPNTSGFMLSDVYDADPSNHTETTFEKYWDVKKTAPLYLILIIFPLLNFKSPTFFTKFNCLGTISVLYLWVLIIIKASRWGFNMSFDGVAPSSTGFRFTFPALTGMLSLAFFLHNAVITILRNNKQQENNVRDLSIGYLLVMVTYMFVGTIFYSTFPLPKHCISSNLLDNLASEDPLAVGARALLLFQMITVFPLLAYIFRLQILHTLFGNTWPGWQHVLVLNAIFVTFCVLIAMFYPHIGDIIRYSGSLCGLVYVFILPVSVHMFAMHKRNNLTPISIILHSIIIVLGLANFIAQFLITPSK
ncbi:neutral amino acid transporter 9-like isoform X2 [Styela clava]